MKIKPVLILYTGGTIGSVPVDRSDPRSPLSPTPALAPLMTWIPGYDPDRKALMVEGQWLAIVVEDWGTPLDSANVSAKHWLSLSRSIQERYDDYEGFVILHGTDTMAYTASALSFILENLGKPVILTGAQRPMGRPRSDAIQNLVSAVELAASGSLMKRLIPEVSVFFRDFLLRGNRSTKTSASDYQAFSSPNFPPLAHCAKRITIEDKRRSPLPSSPLKIQEQLESNVAALDLFPGMSMELLQRILSTSGLRGVILKSFGAGNAPSSPDFLGVLSSAVSKGTLIVDVTQCWSGEVEMGLYETSTGLLEAGLVSGMEMTPEAALTKMMVVLAKESDPIVAGDLMQINARGELSRSIFHLHFPGVADHLVLEASDIEVFPHFPMVMGESVIDESRLQEVVLRIMGLKTRLASRLEIRAFLDIGDSEMLELAVCEKHLSLEGKTIILDITESIRPILSCLNNNKLILRFSGKAEVSLLRVDLAVFMEA
jgi:L-asparaginase